MGTYQNPKETGEREIGFMTYTEAVEKARNNDAAGFEYLYQMTKSNKYYLALKYVKDAEAAKDDHSRC